MQGNSRIDFANTLRGFAALAVVIAHYYGVFWTSRAAVESITNAPVLSMETHPIPRYISWLHAFPIFGWGPYGVALFLLSAALSFHFRFKK